MNSNNRRPLHSYWSSPNQTPPNAEEIWRMEDSVTVGRDAKQDNQRVCTSKMPPYLPHPMPRSSSSQRTLWKLSLQRKKIKPFLELEGGGSAIFISKALAFRSLTVWCIKQSRAYHRTQPQYEQEPPGVLGQWISSDAISESVTLCNLAQGTAWTVKCHA